MPNAMLAYTSQLTELNLPRLRQLNMKKRYDQCGKNPRSPKSTPI